MDRRSFLKVALGGVLIEGLTRTVSAEDKATLKIAPEVAAKSSDNPTVINITYATLVIAISKSALVPFARYRLVDFQTVNDMDGKGALNKAKPEVLVLTAVTVNALSSVALSEAYPQDTIHYTVSNFYDSGREGESLKGKITYREDNTSNISAYFDWRGVKWRRWETLKGNGDFTSIGDTGFAHVDLFPFNNSPAAEGCSNVRIGKYSVMDPDQAAHLRQNIILGSGRMVTMGGNCFNMTIGSNFYAITIDDTNPDFVIGDFVNHVIVGKCSDNLRIGTGVGSVTVGSSCFDVVIGSSSHNIVIGDSNHKIEIPDGTQFYHLDHNIAENDDSSSVRKISSFTYSRKFKKVNTAANNKFTTQDGKVVTVSDGIIMSIEKKVKK